MAIAYTSQSFPRICNGLTPIYTSLRCKKMVMRKLSFPLKMIFSLLENVHERKGISREIRKRKRKFPSHSKREGEENEEKKHFAMQCSDITLHGDFSDERIRRLLDQEYHWMVV